MSNYTSFGFVSKEMFHLDLDKLLCNLSKYTSYAKLYNAIIEDNDVRYEEFNIRELESKEIINMLLGNKDSYINGMLKYDETLYKFFLKFKCLPSGFSGALIEVADVLPEEYEYNYILSVTNIIIQKLKKVIEEYGFMYIFCDNEVDLDLEDIDDEFEKKYALVISNINNKKYVTVNDWMIDGITNYK